MIGTHTDAMTTKNIQPNTRVVKSEPNNGDHDTPSGLGARLCGAEYRGRCRARLYLPGQGLADPSGPRRRVLIHVAIDVGSELVIVDMTHARKRRDRDLRRHEPAADQPRS